MGELRDIVGHTKPAMLGIIESKLGSSVSDQQVNVMIIVFLGVIETE